MKKKLLSVFVAMILIFLCLMTGVASANSWGLMGKLLTAVQKVHTWDNYYSLSNQADAFCVMQSRYHNALFFVDGSGELRTYTTAVHQPGVTDVFVLLTYEEDTLTLRYGDLEFFAFRRVDGSDTFELIQAEIGSFRLEGNAYSYRCEDENGTVVLSEKITLANFNIELFPRSTEEVRHLNRMRSQFRSSLNCLGAMDPVGEGYSADFQGELLDPQKKGTVSVYSAPYGKSAWRAGKGKAAAGLKDDIWLLSEFVNADGEAYACIRYNVSERTQRIGYARCEDLGLPDPELPTEDIPGLTFTRIDVETAVETYLTDDPDVSQFHQFTVPAGTTFSCMGLYNGSYAYVSAEVKDGKFTDGGAIVWGFVPIRDLKIMDREIRTDVMSQLAGDWRLEGGGSFAEEILHFRADGTFTAGTGAMEEGEDITEESTQSGIWTVTDYNAFRNQYWNNPPYEITLLYDNGRAAVCGLTVSEDSFGLTDWEGGGGYARSRISAPPEPSEK